MTRLLRCFLSHLLFVAYILGISYILYLSIPEHPRGWKVLNEFARSSVFAWSGFVALLSRSREGRSRYTSCYRRWKARTREGNHGFIGGEFCGRRFSHSARFECDPASHPPSRKPKNTSIPLHFSNLRLQIHPENPSSHTAPPPTLSIVKSEPGDHTRLRPLRQAF